MTIQWHLTDKCNFRCLHCYQDDYLDNGLSLGDNFNVLAKVNLLIKHLRKQNPNIKCHINFTGGEPFLYKPLLELLRKTVSDYHFTFGILSNGYLLSDAEISELASLKPQFIQLSLEGGKDMNDSIRGVGSYNIVKKAIKKYNSHNIPVIISFTANSKNYKEYSKVVRFSRKNKVTKVWTDRYLPFAHDDGLELTTEQFKYLNKSIYNKGFNRFNKLFYNTQIGSSRAIQFLESGGKPYRCSAGRSLIAILPNGDLLPCRRLAIKLGNGLKDDFIDIYFNHHVLQRLRNKEALDESCKACVYESDCFGGLKCLSYIKSKDFHQKDPNCYIK